MDSLIQEVLRSFTVDKYSVWKALTAVNMDSLIVFTVDKYVWASDSC